MTIEQLLTVINNLQMTPEQLEIALRRLMQYAMLRDLETQKAVVQDQRVAAAQGFAAQENSIDAQIAALMESIKQG